MQYVANVVGDEDEDEWKRMLFVQLDRAWMD